MATFNAINRMPGVFIQEIDVPGPIAGVSTSIAAFLGPARTGPVGQPVRLTSFTRFADEFGLPNQDGDMVPYFPNGDFFSPNAVRGFFDNGGATCYYLRVSNASAASLTLDDRGAAPQAALIVRAREQGAAGDAIEVTVADANLANNVSAADEQTNLTSAAGTLAVLPAPANAQQFRIGDIVLLEEGGNSDRATIAAIDEANAEVTFGANLGNTYTAAGTMSLADLEVGQRTLRVDDATNIHAGSYLEISEGATTETRVVESVNRATNIVTLVDGLANAFSVANVAFRTLEFDLTIDDGGGNLATTPNLSMNARHPRYVITVLRNDAASLVDVELPRRPSTNPPPSNLPAVGGPTNLAGGADEDLTQLGQADYDEALAALENVDEVSIVATPDTTDSGIQQSVIDHCQDMEDRFAVLDPPSALTPTEITTHRLLLASDRGYGAIYYPRIAISNPGEGPATLIVPPSGHIAGLYARIDEDKGVHKAPANERLEGVIGLERPVTDTDHGLLNEQGVNVLRFFRGRGHRVWGARTISPRTQWRYVNVRRLMLFLEESIQEGTEFAVFEPNNQALWETVKRQVEGFLTRVWRDGALVGTSPEQAFRVKVDAELNPPETRALGQLIIEVRVAPTTPAEFIVFRVIQTPGQPLIDE